MDAFSYRDGILHAEAVPLPAIAEAYGTPCYVYSRTAIETHWRAFDDAFGNRPHLVCYAVKANSNIALLNILAHLGSGFDIVSGGELERVMAAGGNPRKIVFSGVGKRVDELRRALEVEIRCFNVEVEGELDHLNRIAGELGRRAPISIRINPDVDARTHPYISTGLRENKFGIDIAIARELYRKAANMPNLDIVGVDCHIGSQLVDTAPFLDAVGRVLHLVEQLAADGIALQHIDIGGGLGIRYRDETPPDTAAYIAQILQAVGDSSLEIMVEPGRAIVGNAGILLTRVEYLKEGPEKRFVIVDAAMNDMLRPALYEAWHDIVPIVRPDQAAVALRPCDVVGPVCETGDFLGRERDLDVVPGDLLAVLSAGAYGFSMSSNYNSRPRPSEILVHGTHHQVVRERENLRDLWRGEWIKPLPSA